jgi:hypothetical protein
MIALLRNEHKKFIEQDPVRPHISLDWRFQENKEVYALYEDQYATEAPVEDENPKAIICLAYTNGIATTEKELENNDNPDTAMFYTVWSYEKGAGRKIVNAVSDLLLSKKPEIKRHVTLSPKTEMARKFHLSNGAIELQENQDTVNYEYILS